MEFNSFGPAVGRLGSDSSRGGANSAKVEAGGAEPPLTLTTVNCPFPGLVPSSVYMSLPSSAWQVLVLLAGNTRCQETAIITVAVGRSCLVQMPLEPVLHGRDV